MRSPIEQPSHSIAAFQPAALAGANLPFIYLPVKAVTAACGMSVAKLYALIKRGEFPTGDLIGAQSRRWKSTDIAAWLCEQSTKAASREDELGSRLRAKSLKAVTAKKGAGHVEP